MRTRSKYLRRALTMIGMAAVPFLWISVSSAQDPAAHIRLVRTLKTSKLGIQNPVGLAFSMNEHVFHVVESRGVSQSPSADSDVVLITPRPAQIARTRIPAAVDPINITFDSLHNRLLILLPKANLLFQVKAGPDGRLNLNTLTRFDARHFGLQDPKGMAVDPATGDLFILDSAASAISRIAMTPDGTFDGAAVSRRRPAAPRFCRPPRSRYRPGQRSSPCPGQCPPAAPRNHRRGPSLAARDLAPLNLNDPQGIVFAPTGDQTDDPSKSACTWPTAVLVRDKAPRRAVPDKSSSCRSTPLPRRRTAHSSPRLSRRPTWRLFRRPAPTPPAWPTWHREIPC